MRACLDGVMEAVSGLLVLMINDGHLDGEVLRPMPVTGDDILPRGDIDGALERELIPSRADGHIIGRLPDELTDEISSLLSTKVFVFIPAVEETVDLSSFAVRNQAEMGNPCRRMHAEEGRVDRPT